MKNSKKIDPAFVYLLYDPKYDLLVEYRQDFVGDSFGYITVYDEVFDIKDTLCYDLKVLTGPHFKLENIGVLYEKTENAKRDS